MVITLRLKLVTFEQEMQLCHESVMNNLAVVVEQMQLKQQSVGRYLHSKLYSIRNISGQTLGV